jgi:hypothetical protein
LVAWLGLAVGWGLRLLGLVEKLCFIKQQKGSTRTQHTCLSLLQPKPTQPTKPNTQNQHSKKNHNHTQEAVEDTVLSRGGEVLLQERRVKGGVHEVLDLKVAIPFLWGVPPEVDALRWVCAAVCAMLVVFARLAQLCRWFSLLRSRPTQTYNKRQKQNNRVNTPNRAKKRQKNANMQRTATRFCRAAASWTRSRKLGTYMRPYYRRPPRPLRPLVAVALAAAAAALAVAAVSAAAPGLTRCGRRACTTSRRFEGAARLPPLPPLLH